MIVARTILTVPAPVLRQVCDPVEVFDGRLGELAVDMLQTMHAASGRGLAAPQVGETLRLFVMDTGWKAGTPRPVVCVNPQIVAASEQTAVHEERCLSIPDTPCRLARPVRVDLRWQTLAGTWKEARVEGADAVCVQHEIDHLDGILCTDRAEAA